MHPRVRSVLFLILGLAAGASAFAQGSAPRAGAVVKDMQGTLTVQTGTNPPRSSKPGVAIPVGAIVRTGAKSGAMLVFPDGQICALGGNSTFRISSYAYDPRDSLKNGMSLNLVSGSLRCVMGEIAQSNPAAVRVQVGVVTVGVDASSARRTDASVVVEGGSVALTVEQGSVVAFLPSSQQQSVAAGEGLIFGQDGAVFRGTTDQILQRIGTLPLGEQMRQEFAALQAMGQSIALTVIMLSIPESAQQLLSDLENLPPPGEIALDLPPPVFSTANTPATGGGGGGTPCAASCN